MTVLSRCLIALCMVTASLKSISQPATKLVITTAPVPGAGDGSPMSVQPVVEIRDAGDHKVSGSTAQVEIVIASGTGGAIGGTTRINAVNGVAAFTGLTFTGTQGETYTFAFKSEPVIASESFSYTGGASLTGQNGGFGWSGAWFGPSPTFPDYTINGTGLTYTGLTTNGGRAAYTSGTGADGARNLTAASNATYNVIWLAFLGNYTAEGGGFNNIRLYMSAGTLTGGIGGNAGYTNWAILDNTLNASTYSATPFDGNTHLALLKIDYTAGASSLWMDPAIASFDGTQTPSVTAAFAPVFDQIAFYNRYSGVSTDEITLASTYKAALHLEQNLTAATSVVTILPVKWTYFTAVCDGSQPLLEWGTTNETNNSHFIVERSDDGIRWSAIGKVQGAGNSGISHKYQFRDSTSSATPHYRLRQVDLDGNAYYSKIVMADCGTSDANKITVFPNPARDVVYLKEVPLGSQYRLMDIKGRLVRSGLVQNTNTTIPLNGLPAGSYFLHVTGQDTPARIIKVN